MSTNNLTLKKNSNKKMIKNKKSNKTKLTMKQCYKMHKFKHWCK